MALLSPARGNSSTFRALWALPVLLIIGCPTPDDSSHIDGVDNDLGSLPDSYSFDSRFGDESSVSYSGQVFRHILIEDMAVRMGAMTDRLNTTWLPEAGDVTDELSFYLEFDGDTSGNLDHSVSTSPAAAQGTYDDIASGKDLLGKLAGNDEVGQHRDWNTELQGWGDAGSTAPEALLRAWIEQLDDQAVAWSVGDYPLDPEGNPVSAVQITAEGHDLEQLIQKFLSCAVPFSQATDDYLDDDIDGKGLLSDNTVADDGRAFTALEHGWDEGFGYFGASRDYGDYADSEIAGAASSDRSGGYFDTNGDGHIDLLSEYIFGHARNAGKRDNGASEDAPSAFTEGAWEAFLKGRAIISNAEGSLSDTELADLQAERDKALANWEGAIAATVVHYINDVLQDMGAFDTAEYSFAGHAKHWSEAKGFALCFQFNPRSPLSNTQFGVLHDLLGMAPVLPGDSAAAAAYKATLLDARGLLGNAFNFDDANMGDGNGAGGW